MAGLARYRLLEAAHQTESITKGIVEVAAPFNVPTYVDLHFVINAIVHDQTMSQPDSVRLHGMSSHVGIVADIRVVEVGNSGLLEGAAERKGIDGGSKGVHLDDGAWNQQAGF